MENLENVEIPHDVESIAELQAVSTQGSSPHPYKQMISDRKWEADLELKVENLNLACDCVEFIIDNSDDHLKIKDETQLVVTHVVKWLNENADVLITLLHSKAMVKIPKGDANLASKTIAALLDDGMFVHKPSANFDSESISSIWAKRCNDYNSPKFLIGIRESDSNSVKGIWYSISTNDPKLHVAIAFLQDDGKSCAANSDNAVVYISKKGKHPLTGATKFYRKLLSEMCHDYHLANGEKGRGRTFTDQIVARVHAKFPDATFKTLDKDTESWVELTGDKLVQKVCRGLCDKRRAGKGLRDAKKIARRNPDKSRAMRRLLDAKKIARTLVNPDVPPNNIATASNADGHPPNETPTRRYPGGPSRNVAMANNVHGYQPNETPTHGYPGGPPNNVAMAISFATNRDQDYSDRSPNPSHTSSVADSDIEF